MSSIPLPSPSCGSSCAPSWSVVGAAAPSLDRVALLEHRLAIVEARLARYESEEARRAAADETSCSTRELERRMLEPELARTWFRPPDPAGKSGTGRVRFMRRKLIAYRDGLV